MADASSSIRGNKNPESLYQQCLTNLVNFVQKNKCDRNDLRSLPDSILLDVYYQMFLEKRHCILSTELSKLTIFERLLRFSGTQLKLLQCFQAGIEHEPKLSAELASSYLRMCDESPRTKDNLIHLGLRLGNIMRFSLVDASMRGVEIHHAGNSYNACGESVYSLNQLPAGSFLNEAGWYADAERVLLRCRDLCQAQPQTTYYKRLTLECCHRLLNTQSSYCVFPAAAKTYALALQLLGLEDDPASELPAGPFAAAETRSIAVQTDLTHSSLDCSSSPSCGSCRCGTWGMTTLLARVFKEFSTLFFVLCDYAAAYRWGLRALRLLTPHTPHKVFVEVVVCMGSACVVRRRFGAAGALSRLAVCAARAAFSPHHPRYAQALLDYGFYLLNIDSITHSVCVYEEALSILTRVFGRSSLHVATAQEDLAYALYVLEYSSGRFYKARDHAERAISIIENLVPPDHLLLASAKRVKALILEEIALDTPAGQDMSEPNLLEESESLHKAALALSMMAFGEKNVQTAKHYGNLGRLYQSMHKFQDAETMHLKAIAIKEELLGPDDYEVGLSIGHLASLYNYHMGMHNAAEKLYKRSIAISLKLFGERYSGLEYDYRGLVHVFAQLKRHDRADHYTRLLHHWHELREQSKTEPQPALGYEQIMPLEELKAKFFGPND